MYADVGLNNLRTYTTASFSVTQLTDVHPDHFLGKCVGVQAALSREPGGKRSWMGIMPLRVDRVPHEQGALELQGDVTVLLFPGDDATPATTGVAIYHLKSDGQNVPLFQYRDLPVEYATELLRLGLEEGNKPLQAASSQFLNAFRATVEQARPHLIVPCSESSD
jgi:hypothetical protein